MAIHLFSSNNRLAPPPSRGMCSVSSILKISIMATMALGDCLAKTISFAMDSAGRITSFYEKPYLLEKRVKSALARGGSFTPKSNPSLGTSGSYLIKDYNGETIAVFKPEDEGTWRPNNPNPAFRRPQLFEKDSWDLGKAPERQMLAELIYVGNLTQMPQGVITEFTSDQFVDLIAATNSSSASKQTKRGYLQEWVKDAKPLSHYQPSIQGSTRKGLEFHDTRALSMFQEVIINGLLTYNDQLNEDNLLVSFDTAGRANLIPIDSDSILPRNLSKQLSGIYTHKKAKEPFTPASLNLIRYLDYEYVNATVMFMELSDQAGMNAKIMGKVLKRFAASGATLYEIIQFVSASDKEPSDSPSRLWKIIEKAQKIALDSLTSADREAYEQSEFLKRSIWNRSLSVDQRTEATLWQNNYQEIAPRINAKIQKNLWREFKNRLEEELKSLPSCYELANLCWRANPLESGVTHYQYEGPYDGLTERFEILKIDRDSSVKLKVQDAKGVFKKGETPSTGRLHLRDLASRVPQAIAAISGGYFHYLPPEGIFYEWTGTSYLAGSPIGELIINREVISNNLKRSYWGAFRIEPSGEISIVDTTTHPLQNDSLPEYSLGSVPLLIQGGKTVSTAELGPEPILQSNQACTPGIQFQYQMNQPHARVGVCKTKNGDLLLIIVEGRQSKAQGLRIAQFARFLKSLDCEDALNLDGGGSADLVTKDKDGNFITSITSSDGKRKRQVANAIVITSDN